MGKTASTPASLVSEGLSKMNIANFTLKSHYYSVVLTSNLSSCFL